jgi:hypothetical protein
MQNTVPGQVMKSMKDMAERARLPGSRISDSLGKDHGLPLDQQISAYTINASDD